MTYFHNTRQLKTSSLCFPQLSFNNSLGPPASDWETDGGGVPACLPLEAAALCTLFSVHSSISNSRMWRHILSLGSHSNNSPTLLSPCWVKSRCTVQGREERSGDAVFDLVTALIVQGSLEMTRQVQDSFIFLPLRGRVLSSCRS